jgi:hypothetical protein
MDVMFYGDIPRLIGIEKKDKASSLLAKVGLKRDKVKSNQIKRRSNIRGNARASN